MGRLVVLTQSGDEAIEWDSANTESTEKARLEFERLKGEGFVFYEPEASKGKRIDTWDPSLGKLIAAPGVQTKEDKASGKKPKAMAGGPYSRIVA